MRRAALLLLLAGCVKPNGKDQQLYFGVEFTQVANGLSTDVLLPDARRSPSFHADFTGTTLEASGPDLTVLESEQLATGGFRLRVRCDATGTAQKRELSVKVKKGSDEKYHDRFDLDCMPLNGVTFLGNNYLAVGAEQQMQVVFDSSAPSGSTVGGHGFAPANSPEFIFIDEEQQLSQGMAFDVVALSAGVMPKVSAGAVTAQLPLTVLDDTQWRVLLTVTPDTSTPGSTYLNADARPVPNADPDGGFVTTNFVCDFSVSTGGETQWFDGGACTQSFGVDAGATGQLCVTHFHHQACQPF